MIAVLIRRIEKIPIVSKQNGKFVVEQGSKVQSLVDEIINDGIPKYKELDDPITKKRKLSVDTAVPSFSKESIEKPILFTSRKPDYLFEEVEEEVEKPMFIAADDDDEESIAETIDIDGLPPPPPHHIVKFLPETITGQKLNLIFAIYQRRS